MSPIITKIKRLRRVKPYEWKAERLRKNTLSFKVRLTYYVGDRMFGGHLEVRDNINRSWRGSYLRGDNLDYLKSLLTDEELAQCVASSITQRHPRLSPDGMMVSYIDQATGEWVHVPASNCLLLT